MDEVTAPDRVAAVEIVLSALGEQIEFTLIRNAFAAISVAALDAKKWLHDPAYVAALEAVAAAAREYRRMLAEPFGGSAIPELEALKRALDAVPVAEPEQARDQTLDAAADRAAKEILTNYADHDLGLPDARSGPEVIY